MTAKPDDPTSPTSTTAARVSGPTPSGTRCCHELQGSHRRGARRSHRAGRIVHLGTERHESRRIDNQLRGRAGRQGDPGASRFYLSLEDDLMRIFAKEWVSNLLQRLGMEEGVPIESRLITRRIEAAQKAVEGQHFESANICSNMTM